MKSIVNESFHNEVKLWLIEMRTRTRKTKKYGRSVINCEG